MYTLSILYVYFSLKKKHVKKHNQALSKYLYYQDVE